MRDTTMVRALALSLGLLLGCDEEPKRGLEEFASTRPLPVESGLFYTMNDSASDQVTKVICCPSRLKFGEYSR